MALVDKGSPGYTLQSQEKLQHPKQMKSWPSDLGLKMEIAVPFLGKCRPFVGRCCQRCTPKSWESLFQKHLTSLGFCSVIKITEENTRYRGWLVRRLCYFLAVNDWTFCAETTGDLQERIFHSERVQDVVSKKAPQGKEDTPAAGLSVAQWMREVHRILLQIQASLSPLLLRFCHWVLLKLLNQMFLSVIVHKGQLEMVRQAAQMPDVPVVFLSIRKSQLDGLLLQLVLGSQGIAMPRVAWESKAFTPTYRALLRRLGGVFLPEGVEQPQDSQEGALSRAVVASYVEDLLRRRQPLLVFLEELCAGVPLRSASGREWLSLVVRAFNAGAAPDVMMVPVGISYDLAPNVLCGGQGNPAKPLGLWTSLWALCRAVRQGSGCCVRVDFAQPASLQEYVVTDFYRKSSSGGSAEEFLLPQICGQCSSTLDREKSQPRLPGSPGIVALSSEQQAVVDNLSLHSVIAGVSCSAIMAAEIMAALLLHKHQEGVFLSRLIQDFAWLTEELLLRNYDAGFSGRVRDVVLHSLFLLRRCVSLYRLSLGDVLVAPKRTEAAVRELSQRSTALLPVFIQEAVGACAVNALLVEVLPYLGSPEQLQDVILVQHELYDKVSFLAKLLPRDLLLCPPCQSLYSYSQVAVDKLIQCGLLVVEEAPSDLLPCDAAPKRFSEKLLWKAIDDVADDDFEEQEGKQHFKVSHLDNCPALFAFLGHLLSPLLKTLERAASFLGELGFPQPESQSMERLHQFLARKAEEDGSFECANRALIAVSLRIYKELGVLREAAGQTEPVLHLSDTFETKENREKLERFVSQFIYI
ncbi:glycerol-3-phosphate acyltransferase 2, mitochondrial isoform X2 [Pogona vitticeps]